MRGMEEGRTGRLLALFAVAVLTIAGSAFVLAPQSAIQGSIFHGVLGCEADCRNGWCESTEADPCCYCDEEGNPVCQCG